MCHGDDGFLLELAHYEAAVLGGKGAVGHARGVGAFAQEVADGVIPNHVGVVLAAESRLLSKT